MFPCEFCKFFKNTFVTSLNDCFFWSNIKPPELPYELRIRTLGILKLKKRNKQPEFIPFILLLL